MSDGVDAAPSACWNCLQRAAPGATRCIWCGVSLTAAAAPLVVAPAGLPVGAAPHAAPAAVPAAVAPVPAPRARAPRTPPPAAGSASASATAGPRLVAITVDVVLLAVPATLVGLLLRSPALGAAVLAELLLLLWILDARTGATPGKALVRLRTARVGTVLSPGAARSFGRGALHGAGLLVGVGPWIVAASAGFDPWRRGWADRATGTATLVVPTAAAVPAPPLPAPVPAGAPLVAAPAGAGRALPPLPPTPPIAEPRVVSVAPMRAVVEEESVEAAAPAATFAPPNQNQPQVAPVSDPPVAPPRPLDEAEIALLLIFDTGQRVNLRAPVAVNLGRNPAATVDGDQLISVDDPESTVSKTHARLEHSRGSTWVTDGGSTNGTEILSDEGEVTRLDPGVRVLLDEGDRVRLGNRVFTVSVIVAGGAG